MAALELEMGGRLLDRDRRRRVLPTPRGIELMAYVGRILALQAEMLAAMAGNLRGTGRLGVSETIVHTWLARLIRRLHGLHPHVAVELTVEISTVLRAGLLAGEIDVALLLGPVAAPGVRDVPLCAYPLAWVARPELEVGAGLVGLARWPVLTYARGTGPYEQIATLFGRVPVRIFANSSLSSTVQLLLDGIGVAAIAPAAIERELADGTLRLIDGPALSPLVFTASYAETTDALPGAVATLAAEVAGG